MIGSMTPHGTRPQIPDVIAQSRRGNAFAKGSGKGTPQEVMLYDAIRSNEANV